MSSSQAIAMRLVSFLPLLVETVSDYYEPDGADCIFTSIKLYDRKRKVVDGKEVEPDFFMI